MVTAWRLVTDPAELRAAAGGYLARLTQADLSARGGFKDAAAYAEYYCGSLVDGVGEHGAKLEGCISKARGLLGAFPRAAALPWSIAVVGKPVEQGYPHTHGSIIVLPLQVIRATPVTQLIETLVHEIVHVYQRAYPVETHVLLLNRWGLVCMGDRSRTPGFPMERVRANPDLNELVYASPACGCTAVTVYNGPAPTALSDSQRVYQRVYWQGPHDQDTEARPAVSLQDAAIAHQEHPYETMAYLVAELCVLGEPRPAKGMPAPRKHRALASGAPEFEKCLDELRAATLAWMHDHL